MKLLIDEAPLKHFLKLFEPEEKVDLVELGDTWHPSNGFLDESILGEIENVIQIIDFDYDFKGLICFEAVIADLKIYYSDQLYTLTGDRQQLEKIVRKIKVLNATDCSPKYNYRLV